MNKYQTPCFPYYPWEKDRPTDPLVTVEHLLALLQACRNGIGGGFYRW